MAKTLQMHFRNQSGNNVTITLPDPRADLTAAEVEAAMNTVIAKNVFQSSGGDLAQALYAEIVDVNQNALFDNRV